jgi:hypothetical protein
VGLPRARARSLRHRAAQLLDPPARRRGPRPAGRPGVRTRRAGLEPAGLRLALRRRPRRERHQHPPIRVHGRPLRPLPAVQPGPARRRRAPGRRSPMPQASPSSSSPSASSPPTRR